MALEFAGAASPLGPTDIAQAAETLGIEPAAILAVCDVESNGNGFLPDKRPIILFESHLFGELTRHRWDRAHPGSSTAAWVHNYGAAGAHQYDRLAEAIALDRCAALQSASGGRFQILGRNFKSCGFADVEGYVAAMRTGEAAHLAAFGAFCRASGLLKPLAAHDWRLFALHYNGGGQVTHYAAALAAAYQRHAKS